jgi:hypothetical protein
VRTSFISAKGGAGCSTVACAAAITMSNAGWDVDFVDYSLQQDARALFGLPDSNETVDVNQHLRFVQGHPSDDRAIVQDFGRMSNYDIRSAIERNDLDPDTTYLVVRADYLHLKAAVAFSDIKLAGIVLVKEPNRALTDKDVEAALSQRIEAVVDHTSRVQRTSDAGLLSSRLPVELRGLSSIVPYAPSHH